MNETGNNNNADAGERDHLSRPDAAHILAVLATSRRLSADGAKACQMGAKALLKRHFDVQRWRARKRDKMAEQSMSVVTANPPMPTDADMDAPKEADDER